MAELDLQSDIVKSVRTQGGYARKLSHRFVVGIPDLVIMLPGIGVRFVEVKDLKECSYHFDRKLGVTPKQRIELGNMCRAQPGVGLILVGLKHKKLVSAERRIVALSAGADRLTHEYEFKVTQPYQNRQVGGFYDIRSLLEAFDNAR